MSRIRRDDQDPNRKVWLLLVSLVCVLCLVFFAGTGRFQSPFLSRAAATLLRPFQSVTAWVGDKVHSLGTEFWEVYYVYDQNRMLKNEVEELRVQNLEANEALAENARLKALLGYKQEKTQFDLVAARVIGRDYATWSGVIVIDHGTASGVRENMPVVTEKGLVGVVVEAAPYSSKVRLILDPRAAVGTIVQRQESRVAGIVEGDPANPMMPRMKNIPKSADVVEGDVVVTSGYGGVYPKGILVGTVRALKNDEGGLLKYAVLESAVDFQRLEDVAVIVASREAPPAPITPPAQTPGTETDPAAQKAAAEQAKRAAQPAPSAAAPAAPAQPKPAKPSEQQGAQPAAQTQAGQRREAGARQ
ncbi:rod shape-determining protein MreC [uncultured Selenomonas sp.]|uniref:rod shape-determining protein MreC n=1 Tax=uncultured Selenomonas sp. TaxID=159275 RepID=UPI0028DD3C41|nr:rod shape-determining protein MreC [uncultured Selenomonas sp.]